MAGKMKFVGLSFLICAFSFLGCKSSDGKGQASVKEIESSPAEKEKSQLLRKIDKKFENPEVHFQLGQIYQNDGLWTKAENEYNIALSFDPVHRKSQAAIVRVLMNSGDITKSEVMGDIYMNQAACNAAASLELALAFQKQQLDDYSLSCYQQALRLAPNSAKINRQIGYYYLSKGDNQLAQEYLNRSFQLNANQPEVAGELGKLGVAVKVPRKMKKNTKSLDKMVDKADKERTLQ